MHIVTQKTKEGIIQWPPELKHTNKMEVFLNGEKCEVLETETSYYIPTVSDCKSDIVFCFSYQTGKMKISPKNLNVTPTKTNDKYYITLDKPKHLYIEVEGLSKPILWYGNIKKQKEKATYYYGSGKVYEIGTLILRSDESVYIEAGAVVRGRIHSEKFSKNIKIGGYGILDASTYHDKQSRTILMDCCKDVIIEDITIINTPSWHMMLAGCDRVNVRNIKEIGEVCGSDGIDIVGSRNVTIKECMLRNNDDCIAIKAFEGGFCDSNGEINQKQNKSFWNNNIENILVHDCIFMNEMCGNGIEIGHELQVNEVKNVVFRNIDIVRSEGYGAALSIHAGDHAIVHNILFEDIRIENYSDFLIDFRVMKSRFNHDKERGQIRHIVLRNIKVHRTSDHLGYTISVIGGWDDQHTVEDVLFENVFLAEEKVLNANILDLFQKNTKNIQFK